MKQRMSEIQSRVNQFEEEKEQRDNMLTMLRQQLQDQKDQFKEKLKDLSGGNVQAAQNTAKLVQKV